MMGVPEDIAGDPDDCFRPVAVIGDDEESAK